ncbi:MAG: response regulator [Spirochaetaceae bacterium]|nr:response regulator [Spirochaetaceae bacterium]
MNSKILIIEDGKEMSDVISLYLNKEGMDTMQCESAEDALALLESYSPDLVVLDLNLPGIDGFEFLKQFRNHFSVPVIIVSARDADEDIISGLGSGADEFITKPFSPIVPSSVVMNNSVQADFILSAQKIRSLFLAPIII